MGKAAYLMETYGRYDEAINYFMAAGMWAQAYNDLGSLPTGTTEEQNYRWLTKTALDLYSNGNTWFDMDSVTRDSVEQLISYNNNPGNMAYAIHCLLSDTEFVYLTPIVDSAWMKKGVTGNNGSGNAAANNWAKAYPGVANKDDLMFSVFPNPTSGELTINSSKSGKLKLYSIDGREAASFDVVSGSSKLILPGTLLPAVYIGKLYTDAKQPNIIRLIYKP